MTYTASSSGQATIDAAGLLNRVCSWTASNGTTKKYGFVYACTSASTTVTVTILGTAVASGDINLRFHTFETVEIKNWYIPGQQVADGTNPVGMQYVTNAGSNLFVFGCDAWVGTAAAGTGAALTYNIYDAGTAIFGTAPSFGTNASVLASVPSTTAITA